MNSGLNKSSLEIGPQHSPLLLSDEYANYIERAVATARTAGFEHGYPIIDLSGQSPGLLYALGAKSIGQPWILGDYPGSLLFAKAGLSHFTCKDIANAWVVFEQDGPRSIPTELMASVGADFPSSYKQVGSWQTAAGAGGYDAIRHQSLYMPKAPSETLTACKILRDNH
ncbi:hypothetical protein [Pseudomonas fluorescens]|uniref:hypothetical protein n=1 Tax=Pseudomonas fluorescens TaxID=294 RepID=UPI00128BEB10|nr:hypothetical protein [Pseudomonas fluorescens]